LYVHAGSPETGMTSVQDSMFMDKDILWKDGFFIAVPGRVHEQGTNNDYIVDNLFVKSDELAPCFWSEEQRNIVGASIDPSEGTCHNDMLPMFHKFLEQAHRNNSQIIISDEWLNRESSETGLSKLIDETWDLRIVIYYRRFYDWMRSAYFRWSRDTGLDIMAAMDGKIRFIDFVRDICARLFASELSHSPDDEDLSFVDLIDVAEYTYHIRKRYTAEYRFDQDVNIVNFHYGNVVESLYCNVLDEAEEACKREQNRNADGIKGSARDESSTSYHELAAGVFWLDNSVLLHETKDGADSLASEKLFDDLATTFKQRMKNRGLSEKDLPKECLSDREMSLFLDVSLAYEKIMLLEYYDDVGEELMRKDFAMRQRMGEFCSIDVKETMNSDEWSFLFVKIGSR